VKTASSFVTEKWKDPEPYGRGSRGTSHPKMLPQAPSCGDWCLKYPAMGDKTILGVLCNIGFFAWKQMNPMPVPGIGA